MPSELLASPRPAFWGTRSGGGSGSSWSTAHVDDERWAQFGPGAVGIGWDMMLMGLALHLSGGEPLDPEKTAAWMASDEGRRLMPLSNDERCQASIAAGPPADDARAGAERTIALPHGAEPMPES